MARRTMNDELATHISLLAAPIYAALLQSFGKLGVREAASLRRSLREEAINEALALWRKTQSEALRW